MKRKVIDLLVIEKHKFSLDFYCNLVVIENNKISQSLFLTY